MCTVFDVNIQHALNLPKNISIRVLLRYDKEKDRKEFTLLTRDMADGIQGRMIEWLEDNLDVSDVIYRRHENALEADQL